MSNLSRESVTTLPAYTVDEPLSAKTHTLFMGADIAINLDKDFYRVQDVWGSNWVVNINGREKQISAKEAPQNLKITPVLKMTEVSVIIVGFHRTQAYSYGNDPSVLLTKGLSQAASINSDLLASAHDNQYKVDTMLNRSMGGMSVLAASDDQFSANALMATAQYAGGATYPNKVNGLLPSNAVPTTSTDTSGAFANSSSMDTLALNTGIAETAAVAASVQTENGNEPAGKIASSGLDAMDVEFDIRSSKSLHNPYVVTMTRFHPHGSRPGIVQDLVFAQSLHPVDEHLSHVHFVEEGFPFGYELIDFQIHIYNRGEEVATNIAADRVELTRDEAFEYIKMEYMGAHRGDTMVATPAMGRLPADLPAKIASGKYAAVFYVRVSRDGLADEAYADPACTRRIDDPYLDTVVKRVRFKPALNLGKAVDGVAMIDLAKLAI